MKPNPEKLKAVTEFPIPKSPKDIKSFLGLASYYRRFIPEFSKHAKSLTNLLKKDVPFVWTNSQQLAFEQLKEKLVTAPILIYPDFTKPFILTCDASNYAISAILSQGDVGKDRPIAYASRTLNKAECNYSVTEKECLAIVYGTKVFRPYLFGQRFKIITDHKPLNWLFNCKDPGSRLVRWRLKLEEFDYEIQYKKGKTNTNADALSRYPVNPIQPIGKDGVLNKDDIPEGRQEVTVSEEEEIFSPLTLGDLGINLPFSPQDLDSLPSIDLLENDDDLLIPVGSPPREGILTDRSSSSKDEDQIIDPLTSNSENSCASPKTDEYQNFLKDMANKNKTFNANILERNENLMKGLTKINIIPTSIDLDESNPYIEEIISNLPNATETLNIERELYSHHKIEIKDKIYYLIFVKVHHFDEISYPGIFMSLKRVRYELVSNQNITKIGITVFKNPFEKHSYIKMYNIITYLFHNTNVKLNIYHNKITYPTVTEIKRIMHDNHDIPIAGHLGSTRMYNRIKENYY